MQFKISGTDTVLPLVREVPAFDGIVRLEGLNGTGKTLTTQVLALCSGRRVIEGEGWDTFCDGLPSVIVEASDLEGATSVRWCLSGERLKASDPGDPLSWFDEIAVDGAAVNDFERVRELFAVEILKGDVGLVETLAAQIDDEAQRARRFASPSFLSRFHELGARIESLRDAADRVRTSEVRGRRDELTRRTAAFQAATKSDVNVVAKVEHLQELLAASVSLSEAHHSASELREEAKELEMQLGELNVERDHVVEELSELERTAADNDALKSELSSTERTRDGRLKRVEKATAAVDDQFELAQIAEDDDLDEVESIRRSEVAALRSERLEIDASPALKALISELRPPLDTAVKQGLAEQILVETAETGQLTVIASLESLAEREAQLELEAKPEAAASVDKAIERLVAQLTALAEIPKAIEKRDRAVELLEEVEARLQKLNEQFDKDVAVRTEALRKRRNELDRRLIDFGGRLRISNQRRDRLPTEDQRKQQRAWLDAELSQMTLQEGDLASTLEQAEHHLAEAQAEREREREALTLLDASAVDDLELLRAIHDRLCTDEFRWVSGSVAPDSEHPTLDELLEMVDLTTAVIDRLDESYDEMRGVYEGVPTTLEAIAGKVRGRDQPSPYMRPQLEAWASDVAAAWFDQHSVGALLLDAGAHDIRVDIDRRLVRWRVAGDSTERRRPLEALSSGQQAFTFTKARLALLQEREVSVLNRLLVLDEYGAFVSHDRLRLLERLLIDWHVEHPSDQILLILPAVQDYATLAPTAIGDLRELYESRAQALESLGYFAEPLRPT